MAPGETITPPMPASDGLLQLSPIRRHQTMGARSNSCTARWGEFQWLVASTPLVAVILAAPPRAAGAAVEMEIDDEPYLEEPLLLPENAIIGSPARRGFRLAAESGSAAAPTRQLVAGRCLPRLRAPLACPKR